MNQQISPWAGTTQPVSSDPGYGNDTNVGFSPGTVGGVPAGLSKWIIQNRMYMNLYGNDIVAGAMVAPIFIMTLLTPMLLIAAAGVLWFADLFASIALLHADEHGLLWHAFALALAAGGWAVGIAVALYFTVGMWLFALTQHRRRGGLLSPLLGWTKIFD